MEMLVDTNKMMLEPSMSNESTVEKMKGELKDLCKKMNQSVVMQSEDIYKRLKKLVVFDVESTLIQNNSLQDFLKKIKGRVKSMDRHLQFKAFDKDEMQVLVENAMMLKGFPARDFEAFGQILQLNPGTVDLVRILKSMGFKIALLSSGFSFFVKRIFEEAGVDYAFSNTLKVDENGIATGELEEPVITNETKEEMLEFIMTSENISRDQVIAVGDGSVGSHFIENAGLSIAFKPDDTSINTDGIFSSGHIINMLYCLGIPKTELDKYLNKDTFE
jgi:phosphoserine phosphatase